MVDFSQIQLFLQGHQIGEGYALLDLFRENFDFGRDLKITIVTNSQDNNYKNNTTNYSEDCFIKLGSNRGYWDGCLDNWNAALSKIKESNEIPYTIIMNFDFWFTKQEGFLNLMSDFVESGKDFGSHAAASTSSEEFYWIPTDFMMFKTNFIHKMQGLNDKILPFRENNKEHSADPRCFEERVLKVLFDTLQIDYSNLSIETMSDLYNGTKLIRDHAFIFDYLDVSLPFNNKDNLNNSKYFCLHTHDKNFLGAIMKERGYIKGQNLKNYFGIE